MNAPGLGPYARARFVRIQRRGHPTGMEQFHADHTWVEPGLWITAATIVWVALGGTTVSWRDSLHPLILAGTGIVIAILNLGTRRAVRAWEEVAGRVTPDLADEIDAREGPDGPS